MARHASNGHLSLGTAHSRGQPEEEPMHITLEYRPDLLGGLETRLPLEKDLVKRDALASGDMAAAHPCPRLGGRPIEAP